MQVFSARRFRSVSNDKSRLLDNRLSRLFKKLPLFAVFFLMII